MDEVIKLFSGSPTANLPNYRDQLHVLLVQTTTAGEHQRRTHFIRIVQSLVSHKSGILIVGETDGHSTNDKAQDDEQQSPHDGVPLGPGNRPL